mmetsp:Transcript_19852/g.28539  ORF Transcript_19852/g.28539 Transcript_19852/m.28539 type:complete len:249 (-) Transcript_19852:195-941(-)
MNSKEALDSIDKEIAEVEELIRMQRHKVDLLRQKNSIVTQPSSSSPSPTSSINEDEAKKSVDHDSDAKDSAESKSVVNPLTHTAEPEKPAASNKKLEISKTMSSIVQTSRRSLFGRPKDENGEEEKENFIDAMTRLQRLTTDLANERNLLAWGRTALASSRTTLAFLALSGDTDFGRISVRITSIGFIVVAFLMMAMGLDRYNKIKRVLMTPKPPPLFDRLSNAPLPIALMLLFILAIVVTASDQWTN